MFKLTLRSVVAIVCVVSLILLWAITDVSTAQSPAATPNESQRLATQIIGGATQTREALSTIVGTPVPPAEKTMTATTMNATRTAIAVTREPYLLTPSTPTNIELTATGVMAWFQPTQTARALDLQFTPDALALTMTMDSFLATQTAIATNPMLLLTPNECVPGLWNSYQPELSTQIQNELQQEGLIIYTVRIVLFGVGQNQGCNEPFYPLTMKIVIQVGADAMTDKVLSELTATMLKVLSRFRMPQMYGSEPATLAINFSMEHKEGYFQTRFINTHYANALAAYAENLRGAALLEALGGLMDSGY